MRDTIILILVALSFPLAVLAGLVLGTTGVLKAAGYGTVGFLIVGMVISLVLAFRSAKEARRYADKD